MIVIVAGVAAKTDDGEGSTVVLNRGSGGGSPNLAPNSILMVLVDLDVHQIVGHHYFDHNQGVFG